MKVIIIGGGVAGLSAGIYARKRGWDTVIYEKNASAGGECTSWKRQGYHIDNCVHWMTGTSAEKEVYETWCDCGVLGEGVEIIKNRSIFSVISGGKSMEISRDVEKFRSDLLAIAPEDAAEIDWMIMAIKRYKAFNMLGKKPFDIMTLREKAKFIWSMLPLASVHKKLSRVSVKDYSMRFKSQVIRDIITAYLPHKFNASSLFFVFGTFMSGNCDLPKGGSDAISQRMVDKYLSLGGVLKLKSPVGKIDFEGKYAKGVVLENGGYDTADYIICACDVSVTFRKLLSSEHVDDYFKFRFLDKLRYPVYSSVNIYIGVDGELPSNMGDTMWFSTEPFVVGSREKDSFLIKNYASEPSFSPEGKNLLQVLVVQYENDFEVWRGLYNLNRDAYKAHKAEVAASVIERIEHQFPALKGRMNVVETVTPMSFYRWCGAYKGAYMSFILTPFAAKKVHNGHLRTLKNVYLSGQWLQAPGGLPNAVVTGRFAISRIAKAAGIKE